MDPPDCQMSDCQIITCVITGSFNVSDEVLYAVAALKNVYRGTLRDLFPV